MQHACHVRNIRIKIYREVCTRTLRRNTRRYQPRSRRDVGQRDRLSEPPLTFLPTWQFLTAVTTHQNISICQHFYTDVDNVWHTEFPSIGHCALFPTNVKKTADIRFPWSHWRGFRSNGPTDRDTKPTKTRLSHSDDNAGPDACSSAALYQLIIRFLSRPIHEGSRGFFDIRSHFGTVENRCWEPRATDWATIARAITTTYCVCDDDGSSSSDDDDGRWWRQWRRRTTVDDVAGTGWWNGGEYMQLTEASMRFCKRVKR